MVALGYVSWVGNVADRNATIVEILLDCGAVPFVRTNVPQTLMVRPSLHLPMTAFDLIYQIVGRNVQ